MRVTRIGDEGRNVVEATEKTKKAGRVGRRGRKEDECRLKYKKRRPKKNRVGTQNDEVEDALCAGGGGGERKRKNERRTRCREAQRELGERRRSVGRTV